MPFSAKGYAAKPAHDSQIKAQIITPACVLRLIDPDIGVKYLPDQGHRRNPAVPDTRKKACFPFRMESAGARRAGAEKQQGKQKHDHNRLTGHKIPPL